MFGDSYLNVNYVDIYKKFLSFKKLGLITIYKNNNQNDLNREGLSDVEFKNNRIIKYVRTNKTKTIIRYVSY